MFSLFRKFIILFFWVFLCLKNVSYCVSAEYVTFLKNASHCLQSRFFFYYLFVVSFFILVYGFCNTTGCVPLNEFVTNIVDYPYRGSTLAGYENPVIKNVYNANFDLLVNQNNIRIRYWKAFCLTINDLEINSAGDFSRIFKSTLAEVPAEYKNFIQQRVMARIEASVNQDPAFFQSIQKMIWIEKRLWKKQLKLFFIFSKYLIQF